MAGGSVIGALRFVLGADTAQLEKSLGKASSSLRAAEKAGQAAGNVIVGALTRIGGMVAGAFAVDSIIQFGAESIRATAAIGRFAEQAGLTAQEFQGLEQALSSARVPQEQLAQGFAIFSRNLSDLQRNTGPLLDFVRRFVPGLESQLRAARSTSEAFGVLTDAVNSLGNAHDRVRLLNAAGAEQFGRLASTMRQGRTVIEETARAFEGVTDEAIQSAQDIERRWDQMIRTITTSLRSMVVTAVDALDRFTTAPLPDFAQTLANIQRLEGIISRLPEGTAQWRDRIKDLQEEQKKLNDLMASARDMLERDMAPVAPTGRSGLTPDQIKEMQGQLTLFMAQLQTLPQRMDFVSQAYQRAWGQMAAVMRANGETEAAIQAARLNLLRQEEQARIGVMGNAMLVSEQLAAREHQLQQARAQGLITELELQRALNLARSEYNLSQLQEMQSLGVTLTFQEQYAMTIERVNNALARGAISAEQAGRAHKAAALTATSAWLGALGSIASTLAGAFQKNKAFAIAAAIINTAQGITKALAVEGPLGWAQAAAIAAAGAAQIATIRSSNPSGGGSAPSVSGSGGGGGEQQSGVAPQTLMVQGINPGQMFSGEFMRDFAQKLLDFQADGGQVILK